MQLVRPAPLLFCFVCVSSPLETGERRREEAEGGGKWEAYEGRTVSLNIKEKTNKKLPWRAEGMAARGGKGAGWKRRQNQIPHMQTGQVAAEQQALPRDQNCELNEGISYARLFCFHLAFQAHACPSISPTLALSSESKMMKRNKNC